MTNKTDKRVVLVTGGAGGLGKATADRFAEIGDFVHILDNRPEILSEVETQVRKQPHSNNFAFHVLDVTKEQEVIRVVDEIVSVHKTIDVLVNCAGIARGPGQRREDGTWHPMQDVSIEDWLKVINVNLTGTFLLCKTVAKVMIEQGKGRIINTASMSGFIANRGLDGLGPYSASKGGVIALTKVLAVEWAKYGITVNAISPGYMATEMGTKSQTLKGFKELQLSMIPQGRLGAPVEFAKTIEFLASDGAGHITGHNLVMDGGYTCW